jgi:hypothetical protein
VDLEEKPAKATRCLAQQRSAVDGGIERLWRGLAKVPGAESSILDFSGLAGPSRRFTEKMRRERLNVRAAVAGRVKIQTQTAEIDHKRLDAEIDAGIPRGGIDEFLVPRACHEKDQLGEARRSDGCCDLAEQFMRGLGIDAKKCGRIGRETETKRRKYV